MNRRAILFMSDMFWFLIFIICAALLIAFLFYPLGKQIEHNKKGLSFDTSTLQTDAQFYALTLSQQTTSTSVFVLGNIIRREGESIADFLPKIVEEKKSSDWKNDKSFYKAYSENIKDTFSRKEIWEVARTERGKITQKWVPTTISVLITQGKNIIDEQCFSSPDALLQEAQSSYQTGKVGNAPQSAVQVTTCTQYLTTRDEFDSVQLYQKELLSKPVENSRIEVGWVHIPTSNGFVTLEVYIRYGLGEKVQRTT